MLCPVICQLFHFKIIEISKLIVLRSFSMIHGRVHAAKLAYLYILYKLNNIFRNIAKTQSFRVFSLERHLMKLLTVLSATNGTLLLVLKPFYFIRVFSSMSCIFLCLVFLLYLLFLWVLLGMLLCPLIHVPYYSFIAPLTKCYVFAWY